MTEPVTFHETAGFRGPKKRSPAQQARDLRRAAARNRVQADEVRAGRVDAWRDGGRDVFLAGRQDAAIGALADGKRELRREVYRAIPVLEGREYRGSISLRGRQR